MTSEQMVRELTSVLEKVRERDPGRTICGNQVVPMLEDVIFKISEQDNDIKQLYERLKEDDKHVKELSNRNKKLRHVVNREEETRLERMLEEHERVTGYINRSSE